MGRVAGEVDRTDRQVPIDSVRDVKARRPDWRRRRLGIDEQGQRIGPISHDPPERRIAVLGTGVVHDANHEQECSFRQKGHVGMIGAQRRLQ